VGHSIPIWKSSGGAKQFGTAFLNWFQLMEEFQAAFARSGLLFFGRWFPQLAPWADILLPLRGRD
jgi:hypothetical protein